MYRVENKGTFDVKGEIMRQRLLALLNRYGLLAASLSLFGLALILFIFRLRDIGILAILFGTVILLLSLFLLRIYFSNAHK